MTYRVLIVDDHPMARKAIHSMLDEDASFVVIAEGNNGAEAIKLCDELMPDLVLMDIHMPECNGLEATKKIKQKHPHIKVVILSVSDDIADLFSAIQFGAQGYLLKNMDPDDWLAYLHALLEEKTEVPREMAGKLFYQFRQSQAADEPSPNILTPREKEILVYVAAGETNRKIAERLGITEHTVKNHIKNILEKLYLDNRVQVAAYALRHGLRVQNDN